jgi:hypothetical protein
MSFSSIPVIAPYFFGDNLLYKDRYGYLIGTILHDLDLFNKASYQEKIDAFLGIYLFSIVSVHMDLLGQPRGLENAKKFKNKIYVITNTIMHNEILQKIGVLYLEIKLLKECKYTPINSDKSMDQILNILDDTLIYIIHMILSFNYLVIISYIESYDIKEIPIIYETINPDLNINFSYILSKIDDKINESFYYFDPTIKFNEYGMEIIPVFHDLFYGSKSIVRNFRDVFEKKSVNYIFSKYMSNEDPLTYINRIIEEIEMIKFIHLKDI